MLSFPFVFLKYLFIANDSLLRPNEIWNNKWEHIAFEAHPCLLTMRPCQISPSTNNRHDSCSRPGRRHTKAAHCFQVSIRLLSLRFQDSFKPHVSTRRCVLRFWGLAAMLWHLNFFQPSYSSHKLKPVSKVEFCHWEWPRGWWALLLWSSDFRPQSFCCHRVYIPNPLWSSPQTELKNKSVWLNEHVTQ